VYFSSRVENVKFVDFCGKYRLPLLQYLCSPNCRTSPCVLGSDTDTDDEDKSREKLKRVLLGWRKSKIEYLLQYRQRHSVINHCDRHITHLGDLDISFDLLDISSKFLLHLECYLLSLKRHIKISKYIKETKRYFSMTKKSNTSHFTIWLLSSYVSDCIVDYEYQKYRKDTLYYYNTDAIYIWVML